MRLAGTSSKISNINITNINNQYQYGFILAWTNNVVTYCNIDTIGPSTGGCFIGSYAKSNLYQNINVMNINGVAESRFGFCAVGYGSHISFNNCIMKTPESIQFIYYYIPNGDEYCEIRDSIIITNPENINEIIVTSNLSVKTSISPYPYFYFPNNNYYTIDDYQPTQNCYNPYFNRNMQIYVFNFVI